MGAQHTPGPWRVEDGTPVVWGRCNPNDPTSCGMGYPIAKCQHQPTWKREFPTPAEMDANARLIAAAPVMLEALEGLRRRVHDHFGGHSGWREEDAAADAISAATAP